MTADNLIHYLQDPQRLYDISYQELKSMVAQYPYCQNLRYLLVYKSKIDQHKDYSKDLELAATYSIDRSLLHQQIELNKYQQANNGDVVFMDDYLELKELEKLEKQLEEKTIASMLSEEEDFQFMPPTVMPSQTMEVPIQEEAIIEGSQEELIDALALEDLAETELEALPKTELAPPVIIERPEPEFEKEIELEITNEEQYEIEDEEIIGQDTRESNATTIERETLIDRILNEWLPPLPSEAKEVEVDSGENKVVSFEDFFEEDGDGDEVELGEKISDIETDEVNAFEHESIEEEVGETDNQAVSDRTLAPKDIPSELTEENLFEAEILLENRERMESGIHIKENEIIEIFEKNNTLPGDQKKWVEDDNQSDQQPPPVQSFSRWLKNFKAAKNSLSDKTIEREQPSAPIIEAVPQAITREERPDRNEKIKKLLKANKKKKTPSKKKKKKKETAKKAEKKIEAKSLANKSLLESEEIISQTLADLLASQGYSEKAIKMYERLSLIFPEKSSFFAQKIKELNLFDE